MSKPSTSDWTIPTLYEHLRTLWKSESRAVRRALKLQATEYERRLDSLNHAHEQAVETAHTYVTLDKYEDWIKQNASAKDTAFERADEKIEGLKLRIEAMEKAHNRLIGIMLVLVPIAGVIGGAIVKLFSSK
jgi:translation initiation factor 2B subunit (eIF-2B alpha/beta/delta family)